MESKPGRQQAWPGPGWAALPQHLVVGNLTLQTEGLDLYEDGVELKTIS